MIDCKLYPAIYKRKSFHKFKNIGEEKLSQEELLDIEAEYASFSALCPEIKTAIHIVPSKETDCKLGQEYCILLYSEKKPNYLQNIGYLGEQLDLYLTSKNIAPLWCGMSKPKEKKYQELDFVIMIAIAKADSEVRFREDMSSCKRKPLEQIWQGETLKGVSDIVRLAPSACNSQPWGVENINNVLNIYRYKNSSAVSRIVPKKMLYFNRIDMGIFLCFLELCLQHEKTPYQVELKIDDDAKQDKTLLAVYKLN